MIRWRQWRRLLLGRASLSRVLSDIELERLREDLLEDRPPGRVLVAGAGRHARGSETALIRPAELASATFIDLGKKEPDIVADLCEPWPVPAGGFDLVVSTWVLEHVAKPATQFAQANRALAPGGWFICAAPFIYRRHPDPQDFHRFTDTALEALGREHGFSRSVIRPVGETPLLCCLSLLWPYVGLPLIGFLIFLATYALDRLALRVRRAQGRGGMLEAYPINYVAAFQK